MRRVGGRAWGLVGLALACGPAQELTVVEDAPVDVPLRESTDAERARFALGDGLFDVPFREPDGLGPLYVRSSCNSCHTLAGRGPGGVEKMVVMDGEAPAADQSALAWGHTVRRLMAAGAHTPVVPPEGVPLRLSSRLGPPIFGRGYLEAVADAEIERVEAEQAARADGIHGRIHRVAWQSQPNPGQPYHSYQPGQQGLIGRFGLKARLATVDEFTADALQGDMGLTSPLRPAELPNPDGLTDDAHPGADVTLDMVNAVADYVRLVELPPRPPPAVPGGDALFVRVRCAVCHVPSLRTRPDYPVAALAGIDAPIYTDLLLHDMGEGLADALSEGDAGPRDWRTAPLIGLRSLRHYLHDGRAATLEEAILAHESPGSEANPSVADYRALTDTERQALLAWLQTL